MFMGNWHYIRPQFIRPRNKKWNFPWRISPVNVTKSAVNHKEHAITRASPLRRYTFVTGVIITVLKIFKECNFLIDLSACFYKLFSNRLSKWKQVGILEHFVTLLDKKVYILFYLVSNNKSKQLQSYKPLRTVRLNLH